ncbi:N(4)-acetylcytidine aminohydrolase [Shewanella sp. NIFS-20-20]|uniref:N(4)-acetylcytidine aminohydrolase n=1 Tax=Shewanella sp. NIFS-20-20 TaxID=2853806 RepID=UPI001C4845A2|nr:N(4)-acetylcytidine aminohydrolase [Shewanella sp. NIFS-20-20]MBV7316597.1 N(4)-acetylcytidine aminohydrolase [Shewanella sp. NIFS-20-20]
MLTAMTFFERFEADILSGKKTITLRDEAESKVVAGLVLPVSTFETGRWFCDIKIVSVAPIKLSALTQAEADAENMSLPQLHQVISDIYPGIEQLYKIAFECLAQE